MSCPTCHMQSVTIEAQCSKDETPRETLTSVESKCPWTKQCMDTNYYAYDLPELASKP